MTDSVNREVAQQGEPVPPDVDLSKELRLIQEMWDELAKPRRAVKAHDLHVWGVAMSAVERAIAQQQTQQPQAEAVPEMHDALCPALTGGDCTCTHLTTVDKAWAQFCGGIGRGPDAPYPGMIEAFESHYGQRFTDKDWREETGVWAAAWKAAKAHGEEAPQQAEALPPKRATGWMAPKDRYTAPVLFNPYTGEPRNVLDVQSDPQGILIVPPGAQIAAAQGAKT